MKSNAHNSKKGMETFMFMVLAAIAVMILLVSIYFISKTGKTASSLNDCAPGYACATNSGDCKEGQIMSLNPCETEDKQKGRCCIDSPI